jgi:hypothetical protein
MDNVNVQRVAVSSTDWLGLVWIWQPKFFAQLPKRINIIVRVAWQLRPTPSKTALETNFYRCDTLVLRIIKDKTMTRIKAARCDMLAMVSRDRREQMLNLR